MVSLDLKELSTSEKLMLMEALWTELSDSEVASPTWHAEILSARNRLIKEGKDSFVDWETAKQELSKELQ